MNRLFIISAIFYGIATGSANSEPSSVPLIEVPCMGSKVMIIPLIHHDGDNPFVKFVSLWGNEEPYITVNNSYQAHVFKINDSSDKYFGGFELKNINIESLTINGCYIEWVN